MRYKDKLEFEIHVDPSIMNTHIVKLTLQPIVENAIYHGLKYKETKGILRVTGYQRGQEAVLEVSDDGVGWMRRLKTYFEKHKVIIVPMEWECTMCREGSPCTMERIMVCAIRVRRAKELRSQW